MKARRKAIAVAILAAGLVAGAAIYLTAPPPSGDLSADALTQTKQYQREMETYGGSLNELASGFREWFNGLWRPPTLGITVACVSVLLALVVFVALTPLPTAPGRDDGSSSSE